MLRLKHPTSRSRATRRGTLFLSLIALCIATFARADGLELSSSPAPITLHFKDAKLQDVTAEITKQTSLPFMVNFTPAEGLTVTLDADKESLWPVLEKLASQIHGSYDISFGNPPQIVLYTNMSGSIRQLISGP